MFGKRKVYLRLCAHHPKVSLCPRPTKVSELEDQLARTERDRLEMMTYLSDENCTLLRAALKPECPVCQVEVKEAVLDPCRHLAACVSCAKALER